MALRKPSLNQQKDCAEISRHPRKSRASKQAAPAKQDAIDSDLSSQPANIQQIKSLSSTLKQSLRNQEPWSTTIEHQRQCLRQQYLALIFHSFETLESDQAGRNSYSEEALNLIWLDTSYGLINIYREKLSTMDQEIERTNHANLKKLGPKNHKSQSDRNRGSLPNIGPVARRKLLQHFRAFLRIEDGFWKSLIHRLVNNYDIEAAKVCLKILKIFNSQPGMEDPRQSDPSDNQDGKKAYSRSLSEFKDEGMLLVHKALICFGDLIRYGELYARTGGQSSPFSGLTNQSQDNKIGKNLVMERDWSRSQDCYNQARLLIPTNGNPSNQLAVLSSYIPDVLSCAYHYYRALCIKRPFPTARQNLRSTFTKALAKATQTNHPPSFADPQGHFPGDLKLNQDHLVSEIRSQFLTLHASLYTRAPYTFTECNGKLCREFINLLKDRLLPPELILKMIAICMAAAWYARVGAGTASTRPRNGDHMDSRARPAPHSYTTEVNATVHFLQFSAALLIVAKDELSSIDESTSNADLSESIPAVLRRILPAMRIISKWTLSGHFDHINRVKLRLARSKKLKLNSQLVTAEAEFWTQYHQAIDLAKRHFPPDKLPALDNSSRLEEDLELAGFLPIERAMKIQQSISSNQFGQIGFPPPCGTYHPNEEHLMRLADLQRDANRIDAKHFSIQSNLEEPRNPAEINKGPDEIANQQRPDFANSSSSSSIPSKEAQNNTVGTMQGVSDEFSNLTDDDDPVELAMRAVVAQQMGNDQTSSGQNTLMLHTPNHSGDVTADEEVDDDDEDVILYLTNPFRAAVGRPESPGSTLEMSATLQFPSSLERTPADQVGTRMSTAADLLASIINTPIATPDPNAAVPPLAPAANWNPFSSVNQTTSGPPLRTSAVAHLPRHGARVPSVSLPKPAEASPKINIWSTLPASSSSSPMEPSMIIASDWPASAAFLGQND